MPDDVFEAAVALVLSHEGGYVCDPEDPGGETNFGICRRSYPHEDIKGMSRARAKAIYYTDWWLKFGINKLPGFTVPCKTLDAAVNIGPGAAIRMLQRSIAAAGVPCVVDGVIGPGTVLACRKADPTKVLTAFRAALADYYRGIVERDPGKAKFLNGWLARAAC